MSKRENEIYAEFKLLLNQAGFKWTLYKGPTTKRVGDKIYYILEPISCIIYFKICSDKPCLWGVTRSRIEEIEHSEKKWFLILFSESAKTGYFLTDKEVRSSIPKWSISSDGDFKVRPANIQPKRFFNSFDELAGLLHKNF